MDGKARKPLIPLLGTILLSAAFSSAGNTATIERVALGAHSGFTRVVFHLDEAAAYSITETGESETILLIEGIDSEGAHPLPEVFHAPINELSYKVESNGVRVLIATNKATRTNSFSLAAEQTGTYRIVVDVYGETGVTTVAGAPNPRREKSKPKRQATGSLPPVKMVCLDTQTALSKNAWDMSSLIEHGLCYKKEGRFADAQLIFERVLTFDPEFHRARLALADIYARQGDIAQAREAYEHVLLSEPPADVTKKIQELLNNLGQ